MGKHFAAAVATMLALSACGGGARDTNTTVVFPGWGTQDRFHGHSPRLETARAEIAELMGHALEIRVDASLEPRWQLAPDEKVEELVVGLGRELNRMKVHTPNVFALAQKIRVVQYDFDATARETRVELDMKGGVMRIVESQDGYGCACEGIELALRGQMAQAVEKQFAGREPRDVSENDLAAYVDFIDRDTYFDGTIGPKYGEPFVTTVRRMLGVHERARDTTLRTRVVEWLLPQAGIFSKYWMDNEREIRSMNAQSSFRSADAAFGAFLAKALPTASPAQKVAFVHALGSYRDQSLNDGAFGGFDITTWGLGYIDEWARSGMPMSERNSGTDAQMFVMNMVCPRWSDEYGYLAHSPQGCTEFWKYVRGSPARVSRAVSYLTAKKSDRIVSAVFANLVSDRYDSRVDSDKVVPLWKRFDVDDASWAGATRAVAQLSDAFDTNVFGEMMVRWRTEPRRRGTVLLVYAAQESHKAAGREREEHYRRYFGVPIDATTFHDYFQHGDVAFIYAHAIWPYLSKGWSRVDAFANVLEAYLDGKDVEFKVRKLMGLVVLMCHEARRDDMAKMHAALTRLSKRSPQDEILLRTILDQTARSTCDEVGSIQ